MVASEAAIADLIHRFSQEDRVEILQFTLQDLQLLPGQFERRHKVFLVHVRNFFKLFIFVDDPDFAQPTVQMLDTGLSVEQLLPATLEVLFGLFVMQFGLSQLALHVFDLLPRHRLLAFNLHPFQVVLDILALFGQSQELLLRSRLQLAEVLERLRLSRILLDDGIWIGNTRRCFNARHSLGVLIVLTLGSAASVLLCLNLPWPLMLQGGLILDAGRVQILRQCVVLPIHPLLDYLLLF